MASGAKLSCEGVSGAGVADLIGVFIGEMDEMELPRLWTCWLGPGSPGGGGACDGGMGDDHGEPGLFGIGAPGPGC